MKSFDGHLKIKLENSEFKRAFEIEKDRLDKKIKPLRIPPAAQQYE